MTELQEEKVETPATLRQVLGAMIFGANRPLTVREMRTCLVQVAGSSDVPLPHGDATPAELQGALDALQEELRGAGLGFTIGEVAGGYRLQSDPRCGAWLRQLLDRKASRLSRPALETLAIVACRQPVTKAEIERIRGVGVDHIIKMLMEMQLMRIVGRSELPGRPFLYGTTQTFLEHFGLSDIGSLKQLGVAVDVAADRGVRVRSLEDIREEGILNGGSGAAVRQNAPPAAAPKGTVGADVVAETEASGSMYKDEDEDKIEDLDAETEGDFEDEEPDEDDLEEGDAIEDLDDDALLDDDDELLDDEDEDDLDEDDDEDEDEDDDER